MRPSAQPLFLLSLGRGNKQVPTEPARQTAALLQHTSDVERDPLLDETHLQGRFDRHIEAQVTFVTR